MKKKKGEESNFSEKTKGTLKSPKTFSLPWIVSNYLKLTVIKQSPNKKRRMKPYTVGLYQSDTNIVRFR